jgi:hypothetical protein
MLQPCALGAPGWDDTGPRRAHPLRSGPGRPCDRLSPAIEGRSRNRRLSPQPPLPAQAPKTLAPGKPRPREDPKHGFRL